MQIDLDALFGAAPSAYVLLDPELRMVWANDAYLKVTGRTRAQVIGRLLTEEFPAPSDSESDQMLRASFRRVLANGKIDHLPLIPYPMETSDGQIETRMWSATQTPLLDGDGQVEFILQNTMDVTDLYHGKDSGKPEDARQRTAMIQRAEAVTTENLALGAMTEFFQSAFDQAPSFMAVLNGPQHVFQVANRSYIDMVGRRDVVGKPVREVLPDLAGQGFFELLDRVYLSGEPVSMKGMPAVLETGPDDTPDHHFVDFIFHPLRDEKGTITGVFVQGHEVTAQKIAETALTATREKFRTMAQTMPNHVWTADRKGALNWLNRRTYEYSGFAEGELYGEDWARVVHPDDLQKAMTHWALSIRRSTTYETEFRIRKADGSFRWHLVRASPLLAEDGTLTGWVGTNTDIEERKTTEATLETRVAKRNEELEELHATLRQSQKMEAIGNLAGGIAHDFNNLLQVITGNLQMVARELPKDAPAQTRLDQAMRSVKRGATLASQLLSFARKQPLAPEVVEMGALIDGTTEILGSAVGEGVELQIDLAPDLWNTSVDPNNLENALLNLAINARDAMEGQGTLVIGIANAELTASQARKHPDARPGEYVVLTVTDTGSGMDADTLERIFEPFFTTKSDGLGTGLGLSMVYGFVRQSGGHATIHSKVGKGTTIRLYLPRSLDRVQPKSIKNDNGLSGGNETILLVEDDDAVRETAQDMLNELGYHVHSATNGTDALALLDKGTKIDLLFTDVVMPGELSGRDLADRLAARDPTVPVLFTSGYVKDTLMHDGQLDTGVHLLDKPYTQDQLAQKIRDVLGCAGQPLPDTSEGPAAETTANVAVSAPEPDQSHPDFDGLRVLLCEDDMLIRLDIAESLRDAGCAVDEAANAAAAMDQLNAGAVSILITDVGLPDRTGEELVSDARALYPDLPVIFATGDSTVDSAATLGNCKVLGKPFGEADLFNAIRSLI